MGTDCTNAQLIESSRAANGASASNVGRPTFGSQMSRKGDVMVKKCQKDQQGGVPMSVLFFFFFFFLFKPTSNIQNIKSPTKLLSLQLAGRPAEGFTSPWQYLNTVIKNERNNGETSTCLRSL